MDFDNVKDFDEFGVYSLTFLGLILYYKHLIFNSYSDKKWYS